MYIFPVPIMIGAIDNVLVWLLGRSDKRDHSGESIYSVILRISIHLIFTIYLVQYADMPIIGAVVYSMVYLVDGIAKLKEEFYYTINENYSVVWLFANVIYIIYCTYFWMEILMKD